MSSWLPLCRWWPRRCRRRWGRPRRAIVPGTILVPSVEGVDMRELLDWVQDQTGIGRTGPRKFYFLIAGAVLLILRALLSDLAVLRPLAAFAEAALHSLASINTVSLIGAFIENVTGRSMTIT